MKKWFIIIICLLFAGLILLIAYNKTHTLPTPLATVKVTRQDIVEQAVAIGSIVPRHSTTIKSQLSGVVDQIFYDAGDYVYANTKLLELRPNLVPQNYAQMLSDVATDKANLLADGRKTTGYERLIQEKVISPNDFDYLTAKQAYEADKAKLAYDQETLALNTKGEAKIGGKPMKSEVISPVEGYILQRNVDVGTPVISVSDSQEATVLFTVANMRDLVFRGTVDEMDAAKLKENMASEITIGALPDTIIQGVLTKLALQSDNQNAATDTSANSNNQTNQSPFNVAFDVEVGNLKIPNNIKLRSGYSATAKITIKTAKNVLTVPERILIFKDNKVYVNLPDKKGLPKLQEITVGISDGINTQVLSGLQEGQEVMENDANDESL